MRRLIKKFLSSKLVKSGLNKIPVKLKKKKFVVPMATTVFVGLAMLVYGLVNLYTHQNKTYGNLYLGNVHVGGKSADELKVLADKLLGETKLELSYEQKSESVTAANAGLYVDEEAISNKADNKSIRDAFRPWFIKKYENLPLGIDESKLGSTLTKFKKISFKAPKNATFSVKGEKLVIKPEKNGYGLDTQIIGEEITASLSAKMEALSKRLESSEIPAEITKSDIELLSGDITDRLDNQYQIQAKDSTITASKKDIAKWLKVTKPASGQAKLEVNPEAVKAYVERVAERYSVAPVNQVTSQYKSGKKEAITTVGKDGSGATNIAVIAEELAQNILSSQPYSAELNFSKIPFQKVIAVVDDTKRIATYTYDVAVWGSVSSGLGTFKAQAAETFADPRGWSAGGVSFQQVSSGGDFTLVLASPSRVASAAPICSAEWSCRVGRFVIINDNRWSGATTAWNNAGGGLRDYRHMVVNHEAGHWLGFGHGNCSGHGQLAPVMQQQSISLQGCRFNPWPTSSEINSL